MSLKSIIGRTLRRLLAPRMAYGWRMADGQWLKHTRVSTHATVEHPHRLNMGDHVFIGHFNFVDASGGLTIGEGCQITNHVSVLTHSSHVALRICGRGYFGDPAPAGYETAPTSIGAYTFVGPHVVIAPGTSIGRGVLVKAYSYVSGSVPDFAIVEGQPARVVGDTRDIDAACLERHPERRAHYEAWARLAATDAPAPIEQES
jgi:acetyltransferase-like isoleucine patch superfamily enzyme